jgi:TetR/AcrR family transcriptional regulator
MDRASTNRSRAKAKGSSAGASRAANVRPPRRGPRRVGRPSRPVARADLLHVAGAAFAELGYGGTSLETIASRTGLRKASLLHHFPSKDALYCAALGELVGELGGLVRDARLDEGDFVERLDRLGGLLVRALGRRPEAARLLLREAMDRGPFLRGGGRAALDAALDAAAEFLAAGMAAGAFAAQDPRQLVLSIVGIHILYFAVDDVAGSLLGADALGPGGLARRTAAVLAHVRRLCLPPRRGSPARG